MSGENNSNCSSPRSPKSHIGKFLIPSPVPTRRQRTYSQSERIQKGPTYFGTVKEFCREKGHGFIIPEDGGEPLFTHISDVDGDYIPKAGDRVGYKRALCPPKNEKFFAAHVEIKTLAKGEPHETWDAPPHRSPSQSSS